VKIDAYSRSDLEKIELVVPFTYEKYSLSTNGAWYGPSMINHKLSNFNTPIKIYYLQEEIS